MRSLKDLMDRAATARTLLLEPWGDEFRFCADGAFVEGLTAENGARLATLLQGARRVGHHRVIEDGPRIYLFPDPETDPRLSLSDRPLQESRADVVAYGAKDTGEMAGGAAAALREAGGSALEEAARVALAESSREIGEVFLTEAFGLKKLGIRKVAHIVTIAKHTPQGSWCPHPERLGPATARALELAVADGARSVAFAALATGEGRARPEDVARMMVDAARSALREHLELRVTFCLPTERDHQAFSAAL